MAGWTSLSLSLILLTTALSAWCASANNCPNPEEKGACTISTGCNFHKNVLFAHATPDMLQGRVSGRFNASDCCKACTQHPKCMFWSYFEYHSKTGRQWICKRSPVCSEKNVMKGWMKNVVSGGPCNTFVGSSGNLQNLGVEGIRFGFNGLPNQSFCLVADKDLHINMYLRGYYNNETNEASSTLHNNTVVRSRIRELGVMWTKSKGVKHKLRLTAREGKLAALKRGPGFMGSIAVDGLQLDDLGPGERYDAKEIGLKITMEGVDKVGEHEVDVYDVVIDGHIRLNLRLQAAKPSLWLPDDAEVHIDLTIVDIVVTHSMHGILGQTYRPEHMARASRFPRSPEDSGESLLVEGEDGRGILDGERDDYRTSGVMEADCKFASFNTPRLPPHVFNVYSDR